MGASENSSCDLAAVCGEQFANGRHILRMEIEGGKAKKGFDRDAIVCLGIRWAGFCKIASGCNNESVGIKVLADGFVYFCDG